MVELKIAVVIKNRRFVRAWAVGQQRSSVRHKRRTDEVKKNKRGGRGSSEATHLLRFVRKLSSSQRNHVVSQELGGNLHPV